MTYSGGYQFITLHDANACLPDLMWHMSVFAKSYMLITVHTYNYMRLHMCLAIIFNCHVVSLPPHTHIRTHTHTHLYMLEFIREDFAQIHGRLKPHFHARHTQSHTPSSSLLHLLFSASFLFRFEAVCLPA